MNNNFKILIHKLCLQFKEKSVFTKRGSKFSNIIKSPTKYKPKDMLNEK